MDVPIYLQQPQLLPRTPSQGSGESLHIDAFHSDSLKPSVNGWNQPDINTNSTMLRFESFTENGLRSSENKDLLEGFKHSDAGLNSWKNVEPSANGSYDIRNDSSGKKFNDNKAHSALNASPCSIDVERLQNELQRAIQEKYVESQEKARLMDERDSFKTSLEAKSTEMTSCIAEKDDIIKVLSLEVGIKTREMFQHKKELDETKAQLTKELETVNETLGEKQVKINSLEEEVRTLIIGQEKLQKVEKEVNEAKVILNDFNEKVEIAPQEQLVPAVQLLIEECKKSKEKAKQEIEQASQALLGKIAVLEKENEDINQELVKAREGLEVFGTEFDSMVRKFVQTVQKLESEKISLRKKLEESENLLRLSIMDSNIMKVKEKIHLNEEMSECKSETVSSINEIKGQNTSLRDTTIYSMNEMKEHADLQAQKRQSVESSETMRVTEDKLLQENGNLQKMLETSLQQINDLQEQVTNKNDYIEALIYDVNQMKEFIVEHLGESVFEKDEKDEKQPSEDGDMREETEATEEIQHEEESKVTEDHEVLDISQDRNEFAKPKVTIYIEQPIYTPRYVHHRRNEHPNHLTSFERRKSNRSRPWGWRESWKENWRVYQPRIVEEKVDTEYVPKQKHEVPSTKQAKAEVVRENKQETVVVRERFEVSKDRKGKEEDPIQKQLEKMIMDLNEKMVNNEKKAKKVCEEKLLEASKRQMEVEENLLAEIEKLKDEKKSLMKKIDDIQWEKAYEYTTQKMKTEKQQEVKIAEPVNKQKLQNQNPMLLDPSKKKKKK